MRSRELAQLIDHTILRPRASAQDVEHVCRQAVAYGFASVCVQSHWLPLVVKQLSGSKVLAAATVGFPLGGSASPVKQAELQYALDQGADEIDMVINLGLVASGEHRQAVDEVARCQQLCRGKTLKVILEMGLLDAAEKRSLLQLCAAVPVDYVKTSTGFAGDQGATVEDVALMRQLVGPDIGVKASGGIRTLESALQMVEAGATRLGCSASVSIIEQARQQLDANISR